MKPSSALRRLRRSLVLLLIVFGSATSCGGSSVATTKCSVVMSATVDWNAMMIELGNKFESGDDDLLRLEPYDWGSEEFKTAVAERAQSMQIQDPFWCELGEAFFLTATLEFDVPCYGDASYCEAES